MFGFGAFAGKGLLAGCYANQDGGARAEKCSCPGCLRCLNSAVRYELVEYRGILNGRPEQMLTAVRFGWRGMPFGTERASVGQPQAPEKRLGNFQHYLRLHRAFPKVNLLGKDIGWAVRRHVK